MTGFIGCDLGPYQWGEVEQMAEGVRMRMVYGAGLIWGVGKKDKGKAKAKQRLRGDEAARVFDSVWKGR